MKKKPPEHTFVRREYVHLFASIILLLNNIDEVARFREERIVISELIHEFISTTWSTDAEFRRVVRLIWDSKIET